LFNEDVTKFGELVFSAHKRNGILYPVLLLPSNKGASGTKSKVAKRPSAV